MAAWIGKSLLIIGLVHSVFGFVVFHEILTVLAREHLFNTISLHNEPRREAAFWFLFAGFALIIVGALVDWIEYRNIGIPTFLLWSLILLTAIGVLVMPISGFWFLLIPISGLLSRCRESGVGNREPGP